MDQQLERLRSFLTQRGARSASITIADDFQDFSGDVKVIDGARILETCNFRFQVAEIHQVFGLIRNCRTLTELTFHFNSLRAPSGAEGVVLEILSLLHTFKVLDLTVGAFPSHEDAMAGLLTGNPTLESCTLRVHPSETVLRKILLPFMFHRVEEKERALLKKLVLVNATPNPQETSIENVLAQVIEHNTLLEHLEVGDDVFRVAADGFIRPSLKAKAIRLNRALKELRLQCTVAEFKEIVAVGGLATPSDRTPNTTLSTFRIALRDFVSVPDARRGRVVKCYDWVADLAKLVASTRTLEHVEVSQDCAFLLERDDDEATVLKTELRDKLQRLCNNELRARSESERKLQSVSVGMWRAVRVGDMWELTYTGPAAQRQ